MEVSWSKRDAGERPFGEEYEVEVAGVLDDCGSRFELDNGLVETASEKWANPVVA